LYYTREGHGTLDQIKKTESKGENRRALQTNSLDSAQVEKRFLDATKDQGSSEKPGLQKRENGHNLLKHSKILGFEWKAAAEKGQAASAKRVGEYQLFSRGNEIRASETKTRPQLWVNAQLERHEQISSADSSLLKRPAQLPERKTDGKRTPLQDGKVTAYIVARPS